MAADSFFEAVTRAFVEAIGAALDGDDPTLAPLEPPDPAGARQALDQLPARARQLTDAADPGQWISALDQWRGTVTDLAPRAFGGPAGPEALLVRLLDQRLPRTAAFLTLAGVILRSPAGADTVDWDRARAVITDPGTAVD